MPQDDGSTSSAVVSQTILHDDLYCLPSYTEVHLPNFVWGELDGISFKCAIDAAYKEVVQWRRNLFKVLSGKAGKAFVHKLTRLFQAYAEGSALESVALTCAMTMPALVLQRSHQSSKTKEHVSCLERRMKAWREEKIDLLLHEGRTIQSHLTIKPRTAASQTELSQKFANLMFEGKVRPAIHLLTDHCGGGALNLDSIVPGNGPDGEQRS